MTKQLIIMMGIQGSGKSTFYHKYLPEDYVRVNLDTLKTRPTIGDRERYIIPAKEAGYRIVGYFIESKLKDCIERNNLRTGKEKIPSTAIACTSNKLQMPSYIEGFDELYFVKNDGTKMEISEWRDENEF